MFTVNQTNQQKKPTTNNQLPNTSIIANCMNYNIYKNYCKMSNVSILRPLPHEELKLTVWYWLTCLKLLFVIFNLSNKIISIIDLWIIVELMLLKFKKQSIYYILSIYSIQFIENGTFTFSHYLIHLFNALYLLLYINKYYKKWILKIFALSRIKQNLTWLYFIL